MGSIFSCVGSCIGSCSATMCCSALSCGMQSTRENTKTLFAVLQIYYFVWLLVIWAYAVDLALKVKNWALHAELGVWQSCRGFTADRERRCYEHELALRFAAGTFSVFAILLITAFVGAPKQAMYRMWGIKLILPLVLWFLFVLLPGGFSSWAGGTSSFFCALFLMAQFVILLDLGYRWNDLWASNAADDNYDDPEGVAGNKWMYALIASGLIFLIGALVITIWLSTSAGSGNKFQQIFPWVIWILSFLLGVCSIIKPICDHGAVLPSCIGIFCITFMAWIACASQDKGGEQYETHPGISVVGAILATITLSLLVRTPDLLNMQDPEIANDDSAQIVGGEADEEGGTRRRQARDVEEGGDDDDDEDDAKTPMPGVNKSGVIFFLMVHWTCTMYMIKLCLLSQDRASCVMISIAACVSICLFALHIFGPRRMTGRDFE